jgi:hypothetical protein
MFRSGLYVVLSSSCEYRENRRRAGRTYYRRKWNHVYRCNVKPCDILKVKKCLGRGCAQRDSTPLAALFFWTLIPAYMWNSEVRKKTCWTDRHLRTRCMHITRGRVHVEPTRANQGSAVGIAIRLRAWRSGVPIPAGSWDFFFLSKTPGPTRAHPAS